VVTGENAIVSKTKSKSRSGICLSIAIILGTKAILLTLEPICQAVPNFKNMIISSFIENAGWHFSVLLFFSLFAMFAFIDYSKFWKWVFSIFYLIMLVVIATGMMFVMEYANDSIHNNLSLHIILLESLLFFTGIIIGGIFFKMIDKLFLDSLFKKA
jgi:hypothetical protein